MSCPEENTLRQLLANTLAAGDEERCALHLSECTTCQQRLETLAGFEYLPEQVPETMVSSKENLDRVIDNLRTVVGDTFSAEGPTRIEVLDFLHPATRPNCLGIFGAYDVLQLVGQGGMGLVLKAFDPSLERTVAIKIMNPQLASQSEARQRFLREARAVAAVEHDHIVAVHAVDESDGLPFLVMQYVDGESLEERIQRKGALAADEVVRLGAQIASGIAAAHAVGLVHRDIKPANILIDASETVKITDFGLAKTVDDVSITQPGILAGTPQYMAPEQANLGEIDFRADLFALGSVFYAMCAGRPPFGGTTPLAVLRQVTDSEPPPLSKVNPQIPKWLVEVVRGMMIKQPELRIQSADEVVACLSAASQPRRRYRTKRLGVIAAVVMVILLLGTAVWQMRKRPTRRKPTTIPQVEAVTGFRVDDDPTVHETLAGAIELAADGATITIHGDGPFETEPIQIIDKSLTIQAADNSRPRIQLTDPQQGGQALIHANSELTLNGLDLQWRMDSTTMTARGSADDVFEHCVVKSDGPLLRAVNCRFVSVGVGCIGNLGGDCYLENCHLQAMRGFCVLWSAESGKHLTLKNSILSGPSALGVQTNATIPGTKSSRVQLEHCTCVGGELLHLRLPSRQSMRSLSRRSTPSLQVDAKSSLFKTLALVELHRKAAGFIALTSPSDTRRLMRPLVGWSDDDNFYAGTKWFLRGGEGKSRELLPGGPTSFEDWKALFDSEGCHLGTVEFDESLPRDQAEHFRILAIDPAGLQPGADIERLGH